MGEHTVLQIERQYFGNLKVVSKRLNPNAQRGSRFRALWLQVSWYSASFERVSRICHRWNERVPGTLAR